MCNVNEDPKVKGQINDRRGAEDEELWKTQGKEQKGLECMYMKLVHLYSTVYRTELYIYLICWFSLIPTGLSKLTPQHTQPQPRGERHKLLL